MGRHHEGWRSEALEDLFGASLAGVRLHVAPTLSAIGLPAFTRGDDVHVAPEYADVETSPGLHVLAHELAHVLQRRAGRVPDGRGLVLDRELEAEANEAADSALRGRTFRVAGAAQRAGGPAPALPYTVLAPAGFGGANVVIVSPQFQARAGGHPQPNIDNDTWPGQDRGGAFAGAATSFLEPGGAVNLRSADPATTSIRLSQNGQMAIEDCDLVTRQAKVFYASDAVINASNARLAVLESSFRLTKFSNQRITVNGLTLHRVWPTNVDDQSFGLDMTASQPCNELVEFVLGAKGLVVQLDAVVPGWSSTWPSTASVTRCCAACPGRG